MNTTGEDGPPPANPVESLRLIDEQRAAAGRSLSVHPFVYYGPWGFSWLVGFGLLFLRFGPDGRVFVNLPPWLPLTALYVLIAAAWLTTGFIAARKHRHVRGLSSWQGAAYGYSWFLAFTGMGLTMQRFGRLLPANEAGLLWASSSMAIVAVLYMAGAAIWQDRDMFVLGAWLMIVNTVGVLAGPGWHSLLISLLGGGGLFAFGLISWLRRRAGDR